MQLEDFLLNMLIYRYSEPRTQTHMKHATGPEATV